MKALIVGDYHDQPVGETLAHLIHKEKPTHLISLSDYDIINSIEEFVEISEKCRKKGIVVIDVPGNHDHAIFNGQTIESSHWRKLKTNAETINRELEANPVAREYLKQLLSAENAIKKIRIGKLNAVIVHGAYTGDTAESFYQIQGNWIDNIWFRLLNYSDFLLNFREMTAKGDQLMIRGHDHLPGFAMECKGIISYDKNVSGAHNLDNQCLQVISPGAFCEGHYAVLEDTKKAQLKICYRKFD